MYSTVLLVTFHMKILFSLWSMPFLATFTIFKNVGNCILPAALSAIRIEIPCILQKFVIHGNITQGRP